MFTRLKRWLGLDRPDEWVLIQLKPERREVDRLDAPIDADAAEFALGLDPGRYSLRAVRGGRFGEAEWTATVGDLEGAEEVEQLRGELQRLREAVTDGGAAAAVSEDFGQQLERGVLQGVLEGDLSVDEARSLADLHARFEGSGGDGGELDAPALRFSIDSPQQLAIWKALDDPDGAISTAKRAASEILGDGQQRDGASGSNLLANALAERSRRAVDEADRDDVDDEPERTSRRSAEEVRELSEGFGGPRPDELDDVDEEVEPTISDEEAAAVADDVAAAFGGE